MLDLISFKQAARRYGQDNFARRLWVLVRGNSRLIGRDFPAVVARYGRHQAAMQSVKEALSSTNGDLLRLAVVYNGMIIGVVTLWKQELPNVIGGVQFAGWLGRSEDRNGAHRDIAIRIIDKMVERADHQWPGLVQWTLVRPEHPIVGDRLKAAGFVVACKLTDCRQVDGVTGPRLVYARGV